MKSVLRLFAGCLLFSALPIQGEETMPDWPKRYDTLKAQALEGKTGPNVGARITICRRIGGNISGRVTDVGKDFVALDGKTFHARDLTSGTCNAIFPEIFAANSAQAAVRREQVDYQRQVRAKREVDLRNEQRQQAGLEWLEQVRLAEEESVLREKAALAKAAEEKLLQDIRLLAEKIKSDPKSHTQSYTVDEVFHLLLIAQQKVPDHVIKSAEIGPDHIPCPTRPMARVYFEPFRLNDFEYQFTVFCAYNKNRPTISVTNTAEKAVSPEKCWVPDGPARYDWIEHLFNFDKEPLYLAIGKENTHEQIAGILRLFEQDKALDENGKVFKLDWCRKELSSIRAYSENGVEYVEVALSSEGGGSGSNYFFKRVEGKLVCDHISHWIV